MVFIRGARGVCLRHLSIRFSVGPLSPARALPRYRSFVIVQIFGTVQRVLMFTFMQE